MMPLSFEPLEKRDMLAADVLVLETFGTNNIAVRDEVAFAAAGPQGVLIVDLESLEVVGQVDPPLNSNSVDDVAVAADLLFALDGSRPGNLSVFSIADPLQPRLVTEPTAVDVGPFAGVSAANGRVIVSGGTRQLSLISVDQSGILGDDIAQIDLGVGQPDVLISNDGETAFVSTDFSGRVDGARFGITLIDVPAPSDSISILDRAGIVGAGFSPGADGPANFPIESAQQDDTLFVASGAGVSVFDISDPLTLRPITVIPLDVNPVNVDVLNNQLFVVGNSPAPTLTVIDVDDVNAPDVSTIDLPTNGEPLGVAATEEHVVIADEVLGILVVNTPELASREPTPLVADIDADGIVGFSDFLVISRNFGQSVAVGSNGDLDEDGFVGFSDFVLLAAEFGATRPAA